MSTDRLRYTRQIRLPEIGEAGQARLAESAVAPSAEGYARVIETTYLTLAGVGRIAEGRGDAHADVEALQIRDPAARDVAEGALLALVALRKALAP